MIIITDAFGNINTSIPENTIHRGSNKANQITLVAPFSTSTQVTVRVQLPNGEYLTEQLMTRVENETATELNLNAWVLDINQVMTQTSGDLKFQFKAIGSNSLIVASFECSFTVAKGVISVPSSTLPDIADQILTKIAEIEGDIEDLEDLKQDKLDVGINTNTWQTSQTVVGSINKIITKTSENTDNIATNTGNIATNTQDIANLKAIIGTGETYIGQMEGASLPTNQQLASFVQTTKGRQPKGGDVVMFILIKPSATDEVYKYKFNGTTWSYYKIPGVEEASNGSKGIVQGTYNIGSANNTIVSIIGGEIVDIYVKDGTNTYRNIREYLNTEKTTIDSIISGGTQVGSALRATQDALGNVINTTYMTATNGATKEYVKNYALPRTFNDTLFVSSDGYVEEIPTTVGGIQFTGTIPVGGASGTLLATISKTLDKEFQISNRNSSTNNFWLSGSQTGVYTFQLQTEIVKNGTPTILGVESTSPINMTADELYNVSISELFTSLGYDDIVEAEVGDVIRQKLYVLLTGASASSTVNLYCNTIYTSCFNLNVQGISIKVAGGLTGELPVVALSSSLSNANISLETTESLSDNVYYVFKAVIDTGDVTLLDSMTVDLVDGDDTTYSVVVPRNYLNGSVVATVKDLKQVFHKATGTTKLELLFKGLIEKTSGGNDKVYIQMDDISTIKADITADLVDGTIIPAKAVSAEDYATGGTIESTFETHNTTLANIIKGDYLTAGTGIGLTKTTGGVTISSENPTLEVAVGTPTDNTAPANLKSFGLFMSCQATYSVTFSAGSLQGYTVVAGDFQYSTDNGANWINVTDGLVVSGLTQIKVRCKTSDANWDTFIGNYPEGIHAESHGGDPYGTSTNLILTGDLSVGYKAELA